MSRYYGVGEFCDLEDQAHLEKFVQNFKKKLFRVEPVERLRCSLVNTFKVDSFFSAVLQFFSNKVAQLFFLTPN